VAKDDAYTATFGQTLTVSAANGLLKNDTQGSATAQVASFGGGSAGGSVTSTTAGNQINLSGSGALRVNADGSFTFTPPNNSTATFTFQYRLSSPAGTSDATVTIGFDDIPPTAVNDTATVSEDAAATVITVLSNDTDPDGGTKAVQSVT